MNSKQRRTLRAVFAYPKSGTIEWEAIEMLILTTGARKIEGRGSRVRFVLGSAVGTFHRPHPEKDAKGYQIKDARSFLEAIGVTP